MESKMPLLTIFTPTYNRATLLFKLYQSLREQRLYNFEWLIVDDGSTDHTSLVIEEIRRENKDRFPIRYYQKGNGGKHTAINVGAREAKGDLFFNNPKISFFSFFNNFFDFLSKSLNIFAK